jgi:hypothetical protein
LVAVRWKSLSKETWLNRRVVVSKCFSDGHERSYRKSCTAIADVCSDAGRDLEIICAKCLEREPPARYQSVADLAEDLECWLEARSITARQVTVPVRIWRKSD